MQWRTAKNLFFAIFPWRHLIIAAVAILAILFLELNALAYICLNVLIMFFFLRVSIFIHEVGHAVTAKLVGGTPRRITIGRGHEVTRVEVWGVKIVVNSIMRLGLAYSYFDNRRHLKWKLAAYTAGGPMANLLMAALMLPLVNFSLQLGDGVLFFYDFLLVNGFLALTSLIPYNVKLSGMKLPNDGLTLFSLPFMKKDKLDLYVNAGKYIDAYDAMDDKQYQKALDIYDSLDFSDKDTFALDVTRAILYLKLGEYEKATTMLDELLEILESDESKKMYAGYLHNGIAWLAVINGNLVKADKHSALAIAQQPAEPHVIGTRGTVLVEMGEHEQGIELLLHNADFNFANDTTLTASMYLMVAYHNTGDSKREKKHAEFVQANNDKLAVDELLLYERCLGKIKS